MVPALATKRVPLTVEEFLARMDTAHAELIFGSIVEKASPSAEHGSAQGGVDRRVGGRFARKPGGRWPGGWWFFTETEVQFGTHLLRPDLCAYRREHVPTQPTGRPLTVVPDWVCEVLSDSTEAVDRGRKMRIYRREGVGHVWLVDPRAQSLEVWRLDGGRWREVETWEGPLAVRAEPFDAIELDLSLLWAR